MNNNIKPEDSVTITTTYGELAKVYAVFGKMNGSCAGVSLFHIIREAIDPSQKIYDSFIYNKDWDELKDFKEYRDEWMKLLFERETEQRKQIRDLEETIKKAQAQIEQLQKLS